MKQKRKLHVLNVWTVMGFSILCIVIFCHVGMQHVTDSFAKYTDFLVGNSALTFTNKTGEWSLFWSMLLLGSVLVVLLAFLQRKTAQTERIGEKTKYVGYSLCCFLPMLIHLFIYGKTTPIMLVISAFCAALMCVFRKKAQGRIAFFICLYFAIEVFAVILGTKLENYWLGDRKVLCIALLFFALICCFRHFHKETGKGILSAQLEKAVQLFIPLLLLLYLKDRYEGTEGSIRILFPRRYELVVISVIILLIFSQLWQWRRGKNKIFFATAFSVFAFVSYVSPALILQSDLHHHGEQILPWQQIVELGQKAYEAYSPASGMFPMIPGAILHFVMKDSANAYGASYALFMLLFEFILMLLLYRRLGGEWTLFIAALFHMPVYCRTWVLLPALLLLSDKKLLANRLNWLTTWVLVCFLGGIYYPLFGAALLIGTLPFGAVQVLYFVVRKEWKKKRKATEWIYLGLVLCLCTASVPFLLRMAKHVLSMAGQTIAVDGETILGQSTPDWFMPYLTDTAGLNEIYCLLRFSLGIIFVLFCFYFLARYLKMTFLENHNKESLEQSFQNPKLLLLTAVPMILCICYTYTMVIMDEHWVSNLLSRSSHIIVFLCGILGVVILKEQDEKEFAACVSAAPEFVGATRAFFIAAAMSVPFWFFYQCGDYHFPELEGTTDDSSYVLGEYAAKLQPYQVKDGYICVTDDLRGQYPNVEWNRIGAGFVKEDVIQHTDKYEFVYAYLKQFDPQIRIMGFEQTQFYYYLLNEPAVYSGRTAIARSRTATKNIINSMEVAHTAVRPAVQPLGQYYLYRYLVSRGYCYSSELDLFLPPELYETIYGQKGSPEPYDWTMTDYCGNAAAAFGNSMESLCVMEETGKTGAVVDGQIILDEPVVGMDADFLYLELENCTPEDAIVSVSWDGDSARAVSCSLQNGKLLVPMGIDPGWLMGTHDTLNITIKSGDKNRKTSVRSWKLYHLQPIFDK